MAIQQINAGETGATVRGKINDNFTELESEKFDASLIDTPTADNNMLFGDTGRWSEKTLAQSKTILGLIFGATANTYAEGNHLHTGVYEPANANIQDSVSKSHTHANKAILDNIEQALTTVLKSAYDDAVANYKNHSVGVALPVVPTFSDNADGTATFGATEANLFDNANFEGTIKRYSVASATLSFVDGQEQYVCIKYNSGTPIYYVENTYSNINCSDVICVYTIWRQGIELHSKDMDSLGLGLANKIGKTFTNTHPYQIEYRSQLSITENGSRNILVSSANVYSGVVPTSVLAFNSTIDRLSLAYHVGGVWTYADNTVYNNSQYDDGTNLVSIPTNKFAARWYYRSIGDIKQVFYILGSNYYNSEADAKLESRPLANYLPLVISGHCIPIGRSIIKAGASTGLTETLVTETYQSTNVIKHNDTTEKQGGDFPLQEYYHLNKTVYDYLNDINAQLAQLLSIGLPTFAGIKTAKLVVLADGTTAFSIYKADGTTKFVNIDTTNLKLQIGDFVGGNYFEVQSNGFVWRVGEAMSWNDLNFDVSKARGTGSTAPSFVQWIGGIYAPAFGSSSNQTTEVFDGTEIPHDYCEGTDLYVHCHWSPFTANSGTVKFFFEYTIANINDTFTTTTTLSATRTVNGEQNKHILTSLGVISGTGIKIGARISFRFYRIRAAANPEDTYTNAAILHNVGIHYLSDTFGSREIGTK